MKHKLTTLYVDTIYLLNLQAVLVQIFNSLRAQTSTVAGEIVYGATCNSANMSGYISNLLKFLFMPHRNLIISAVYFYTCLNCTIYFLHVIRS